MNLCDNSHKNRKEQQRQQPVVKAKKLDIDFDHIGGSDKAEEEKKEEVPVAAVIKEEKVHVVAPVIPKKADHTVVKAESEKFKKMKAISSSDYYRYLPILIKRNN